MNKEEFLLTMQNALSGMPRADLEKTLQYYREMIEERVEEGMTEAEAVADVGDPIELAEAIRSKPAKRTAVQTTKPPKAPKPQREPKPMSGGKKAVLIVCAVLLIAAGVGVILASLHIGRKNVMEKEYTFANDFVSALEIESGSAEVKLLHASDGVCRVVCVEGVGHEYRVWTNDGTLHVERIKKWSLFPVSLSGDHVRVYLPDQDYASLWVKSSSGGVSVPEGFRFNVAIVDVSSGGVGFAAEVTEEMNIRASSGGVAVSGSSPDSLFISASSGGVSLSRMTPGNADVHISSGTLRLDGVHCSGGLRAESSSGAVRFSDVIADGKLELSCSSGSIKLDDCDAAELDIECTSGSVSGHLLTPKLWSASAVSGSILVPESVSGAGLCSIRTTSGSIHCE